MRKRIWIIATVTCVAAFLLLSRAVAERGGSNADASLIGASSDVRDGDVIFVTGRSLRSLVVRALGWGENGYSHVGIVSVDGETRVIHAIPSLPNRDGDGRVYSEPIGDLLSTKRISKAVLYRPKDIGEELRRIAVSRAQELALRAVPFDHEFRMSSRDRLYCTELIVSVFRDAGVNLLEWDVGSDDVLTPDQLSRSPLLVRMAEFTPD